ncbi:hypothetical protein Tsubulata_016011 [Turnera subulata]|uniref:RING-type E3 ubiquitin transferase n=1 Tax=Turnera subulata TaxID=218843 RepID=A0A9Q0FLC2_9ROSI|nr:hypothetical protein Tsubulata_016011 [Turnera subulata]
MCGVPDQNSSACDSPWNKLMSSSAQPGQPNSTTAAAAAAAFLWSCYFATDTQIPGADNILPPDDEDLSEDDFMSHDVEEEDDEDLFVDDLMSDDLFVDDLMSDDVDEEDDEDLFVDDLMSDDVGEEDDDIFLPLDELISGHTDINDSNDFSPCSTCYGADDEVLEAPTILPGQEDNDYDGDGDVDFDVESLLQSPPANAGDLSRILRFARTAADPTDEEAAQLEGVFLDISDFIGVDDGPRTLHASKESIQRLDKVKIEGPSGFVCSVCMEDLQIGSVGKRMPCQHVYHGGCIDQWLMIKNTCPTCRYQMPVDPD